MAAREERREAWAPAVPLEQLAAPGRLTELSGVGAAARHTTAAAIVRKAQLEGETTGWVQPASGPLYPPDLAESSTPWSRCRRSVARSGWLARRN